MSVEHKSLLNKFAIVAVAGLFLPALAACDGEQTASDPNAPPATEQQGAAPATPEPAVPPPATD